jgi:hypothetical protein
VVGSCPKGALHQMRGEDDAFIVARRPREGPNTEAARPGPTGRGSCSDGTWKVAGSRNERGKKEEGWLDVERVCSLFCCFGKTTVGNPSKSFAFVFLVILTLEKSHRIPPWYL